MSDNLDTNAIVYRALVASIAKELTWEEIYEVAFIWLKGNGDISKYIVPRKRDTVSSFLGAWSAWDYFPSRTQMVYWK